MISKCGVICATDCRTYQVECAGCNELEGKISWAAYYGETHCPIYACAVNKGYANCGACGQAPCALWISTRNPDASDAEFARDIASRLHHLNAIASR